MSKSGEGTYYIGKAIDMNMNNGRNELELANPKWKTYSNSVQIFGRN